MTQQITKPAKLEPKKASALAVMADRISIDPAVLHKTLKETVFKGATDSELVALVLVSNEYNLNPLTKQLYAFPKKGGGIEAMVPIDGWLAIINRHEQFDGMETADIEDDKGKLLACECTIYRKDRKHPTKLREYLTECVRKTEPWNQMPRRMLRNKAIIQCARVAFSLSGIVDEDEAHTIGERQATGREVNADPMTAGVAEPKEEEPTLALNNDPETPMEKLGRLAVERKVPTEVLCVEAAEAGLVKEKALMDYSADEINTIIKAIA